MNYILAYDFGTGGIKAALYNTAGQCLADGFESYPTLYPAPDCHEQSPAAWWQATISSTRKMLARIGADAAQHISCIGISGHSLGVVPLDTQGTLLRAHVPIWSDARAHAAAADFFAHIPEEEWYQLTGNGFPAPLYSIFKLMWFRTHEPEMYRQIDVVLGTKDYINYLLTGVKATDHSYASGSGVYDLKARCYCDRLIAASGITASILAPIVESTQVLGTLTAAAAAALGLPRSVKVVAGGVDNSCMSLGAGAFRDGRAYNSLGSSSWIAVSGSAPLLESRLRPYVFAHVVPGQYVSALAIFSAGTALAWVRDQLCRDLKEAARTTWQSAYALMDAAAAAVAPGANGIIFNPTLAGGSALDATPALKGAFLGLTLAHTRDDLIRATLEGVAMGLRQVLNALQNLTTIKPPLTLAGGGANSALWCQICADVFAVPLVTTSAGQQAAALGAAALAAVGTGLWRDFAIVDQVVTTLHHYAPDASNSPGYQQLLEKYCLAGRLLGEYALYGTTRHADVSVLGD